MSPPPAPPTLPHSPAAERNAPPILQALQGWLPARAVVLEVASGTGQHAQHFAGACPGWQWQPSEATAAPLAAIAARCAGLANVAAPAVLDVLDAQRPWPLPPGAADAVFVANLLHIAPWAATAALMQGAAQVLRPGGLLVVYGPFVVAGEPLAPSNAAFDADLRARNPLWGLRALHEVQAEAAAAGLQLAERLPMPAHNQLLRFVRVLA